MRLIAAASATWLAVASCVHAACETSSLPPEDVILRFDVTPFEDLRDTPLLTVFGNGVVRVPLEGGLLEGKLEPGWLQTLMDALNAESLSDLTSEAIARSIAPQGNRIDGAADGRNSRLLVYLPGCMIDLAVPNSAFSSLVHPDAAPLQAFRRFELQLLEIVVSMQTRRP